MRMRRYLVTGTVAVLASMSCGCTSNQSIAASANANPAAKTYTSDDLAKTGKRDTGEALRAADPSVATTTAR